MKKNKRLKVDFSSVKFDSKRFEKYRIKVMHAGNNFNNLNFNLDVIQNASPTLANIPILAFVKKGDGTDEADFAGHEMEWKFTENGITTVYLGRPIGMIPETNNYTLEVDEDNGMTYVVADGYIWKNYANDALEILARKDEKSVSMEVSVEEGESTDEYFDVAEYEYLGICMLGEDVPPAMVGAKAMKVDFSMKALTDKCVAFSQALSEELNFTDEEEEENVQTEDTSTEDFENDETQSDDDETSTEEELEEEFVEDTNEEEEELAVEEDEEEEFSADAKTEDTDNSLSVETLSAEVNSLKAELESVRTLLSTYQEKAFEALFESFSDLSDEVLTRVKAQAKNLTFDNCELLLFAERGRIAKPNFSRGLINLRNNNSDPDAPEWADLVRK